MITIACIVGAKDYNKRRVVYCLTGDIATENQQKRYKSVWHDFDVLSIAATTF